MALWIQQEWRIPDTGLQQWMWSPKKEVLSAYLMAENTFGIGGGQIRREYQRFHRFSSFRAGFPNEKFHYRPSMPIINVIDCKRKGSTKAFLFAPSMFSKGSIGGNIGVFEDLNVKQMGIEKTNARWSNWLTLWWGDLKTEILMRNMQSQGISMNRAYNQY